METQPYDNGAIPFTRPERRRKREKRKLVYNAAADHRAQRIAAIREFEAAHKAWKAKGTKRFEFREPTLADFLPDHLKDQPAAADDPQPHIPQDEDEDADVDAPIFPQTGAGDEDDSAVPGLGQAPKKAARKAARPRADTTTDIDIP